MLFFGIKKSEHTPPSEEIYSDYNTLFGYYTHYALYDMNAFYVFSFLF